MTSFPRTLIRALHLAPGSQAAEKAEPVWAEAQALGHALTWMRDVHLQDFFEAFAPYAAASAHLTRTLAGCARVRLMAATLGPGLEQRVEAHFAENRPFAGYLLDRMGSFLVDRAIRGLHAATRAEHAAGGGSVTRRYSPGYADFSLEAQHCFLRAVGGALPGMSLSKGLQLTPAKSVTALCGIAL